MLNCFACNSLLPERGLFCKKCGAQFKCKSCGDLLEPDADVCVMCGELVGSGEIKKNDTAISSQTMNTFEFRETRNERSAKAVFTDNSVDSLKEALSLVVSSYPLGTIVKKQNAQQSQLNGANSPDSEAIIDAEDVIDITPKQIPQAKAEVTQKIEKLFYLDNSTLTLEVKNIKATGQKDFGVRLAYLRLLFSKEVNGEEYTLRENLNATLKEAMGALDPHVVNWISNATDLAITENADRPLIRLKSDGYSKALEVLNEVYNDALTGEFWTPEKKSKSKSNSKSDNSEKTSKPKSSGGGKRKSTDAEDWINKWKELKLNVDLHGIAKDISQLDRVVLALWVINKSTGGTIDSARTTKISPVITDLFFASGNRGNLNTALKNGYKDHLQKTPDGWRITPTGIKHAETLAGISTSAPKSTKGKK